MIRLPIDPVLAVVPGRRALARRTGMSLRTIGRWCDNGVPYEASDRLAVALGYHPLELWPDWHAYLDAA
jgi:lambda repressor-like predicted transcriptional regulator